MKTNILVIILLTVFSLSLQANEITLASELSKYNDMKIALKVKKLEDKRNLVSIQRDFRDRIRACQNLKRENKPLSKC